MATAESGDLSATALEGGCFGAGAGFGLERLLWVVWICWVWMGGESWVLRGRVAFGVFGAVCVESCCRWRV